jgi:hypothetical protein
MAFLARAPEPFLEEAERGEPEGLIALAHDLPGRILPTILVLATGRRGHVRHIAAALPAPDSRQTCLNLSQLCLSGRIPWQWPVPLESVALRRTCI